MQVQVDKVEAVPVERYQEGDEDGGRVLEDRVEGSPGLPQSPDHSRYHR